MKQSKARHATLSEATLWQDADLIWSFSIVLRREQDNGQTAGPRTHHFDSFV
jgi:hypothetical protein